MAEFPSVALGNQSPPVVALGGGHGLSVTLRALRRLTNNLTAIVGVADDGGSSGRLRVELGVPPPGDLRMALAALCGDDAWGRTWSRVMQHRFGGTGELAGHATGNLLIAALWEETGDVVEGLDWVAALLGANGRVLPVANVPLNIVATVRGLNPEHPGELSEIRGQVELEHTRCTIERLRVEPAAPAACPQAVEAIDKAESIVLGPGSWYTSVLPHLLVPSVRSALARSQGQRLLVLNLDGPKGTPSRDSGQANTEDFETHDYLRVWAEQFPDVRLDWVLADPRFIDDKVELAEATARVGADLVLRPLAVGEPSSSRIPRHDDHLLAAALAAVLGRGSISAWQ